MLHLNTAAVPLTQYFPDARHVGSGFNMKSKRFSLLLFCLYGFLIGGAAAEDWPRYRRDLNNSGRSAETFVSSANVSWLKLRWKYPAGAKISASPAVATVGGRSLVFVGAWDGTFYALDAITGTKVWSRKIDIIPPCNSTSCRIASSAAVRNGKVYFGARNAFLYALDAATGAVSWKVQLANPNSNYEIWSSPAVSNGLVYVGLAGADDSPCVQGRIEARNANTGAVVWKFNTIDQTSCPSGTCVGATVWSSVAIDAANDILFADTGNPGSTCVPASANAARYPDSLLALRASTGQLLNYFQAIPNDNQDLDFGSSPALHKTGTVNACTGATNLQYWVTAASKNGVVYVIKRDSGGLLTTIRQVSLDGGPIASPAIVQAAAAASCGTGSTTTYTNSLYVPTPTGSLYKLSQGSAGGVTQAWKRTVATQPIFSAPAAIRDLIFVGANDQKLHAYNSAGTSMWSYQTGGTIASGPAISNGRVYVGSNDGNVYCFSLNAQ
jgi:outer membrane protein assembly factor BamB